MIEFYQRKSDFHFKEYQLATDANKKKAAAFHMREYLNYQDLIKQTKSKYSV